MPPSPPCWTKQWSAAWGWLDAVWRISMAVGQAWGEGLADEVLRDLANDGFELPPGLRS